MKTLSGLSSADEDGSEGPSRCGGPGAIAERVKAVLLAKESSGGGPLLEERPLHVL
jgi:hypothetical protein